MRIPPRIQLNIINRCQLECNFCVIKNEKQKPLSLMSMKDFKNYIKKCVAFGVREFELTPIVGDPMLDPCLIDRIKILSQYGICKILFYTNLVTYGQIEKALDYEKVEVNISIYGGNRKEYIKNTNHDFYNIFTKNLNKLLTYVRKKEYQHKIKLWIRYKEKNYNPYMASNDIEKIIAIENTNWQKMLNTNSSDVKYIPERKGICRFIIEDNCILPDGNIIACGWFDKNKQMIIGNINKESLEHIYREDGKFWKILEEQNECNYRGICSECTIWKKNFDSTIKWGEIIKILKDDKR